MLIDADYVLKIIGDQLYGEMSAGDEYLYDRKTYDDGLEWCFELIRNVANNTVVDSEPVKHAHWTVIALDCVDDLATLKCSRCGIEREVEDGYIPDYCEGCGAKMDEEKESNHD